MKPRLSRMQLRDRMDAARLLGADSLRAFVTVMLPNLRPVLLAWLLLSLALLLATWVLANLLLGLHWLAWPLYDLRLTSGYLVMVGFSFTLVLTWLATQVGK